MPLDGPARNGAKLVQTLAYAEGEELKAWATSPGPEFPRQEQPISGSHVDDDEDALEATELTQCQSPEIGDGKLS
jgi:hypothetical protein